MTRLKQVLIFLFVLGVGLTQAQTTSITGLVTDAGDGSPIPGVSVFVKGTTIGTVTNIDGRYNLQVEAGNQTLVFSFIGMSTQEVLTQGRNTINAVMESATLDVEEVVVTAYGSKGKVGLKGAISVVTADELEQVPVASFDQMLQGKATGLSIISGSGQPGSGDTKVRIRGTGSIMAANEPLYVVDGVPIEPGVFASMNANDFETVSVLKDAASTSIYGSRASNGVILITTKKGTEGATTINYRHQTGFSFPTRAKFDMMNTAQKLWFEEIAKKGPGWDFSSQNPNYKTLSPEARQAQDEELARLYGIEYDWYDEIFQVGQTNSNEVNLSGGTKKTKFYVSYQNYYQEGIADRSNLNRNVIRLNLNHEISNKIRFTLTSSLGVTNKNMIESEGGVALNNPFAAVYLANPYENPYDENGNLTPGNYYYQNPYISDDKENSDRYGSYSKTGTNSLDITRNSTNKHEETKFIGAANIEWDIFSFLTFKTQYGIDYRHDLRERWVSPDYWIYVEKRKDSNNNDPDRNGYISEVFGRRIASTFVNTLDFKKQINDDHLITAVVGTEYLNRQYFGFNYTGYGLDSKLPETPAAITPGSPGDEQTKTNNYIPNVGGYKSERALFSMFSLVNYTFKERYTLSASLRRDGSSAFGENNKYATLYSAGFTWDMKRESFLETVNWINNLKFRVSYGTTGNQEGIGNYESQTLWGNGQYNNQSAYYLAQTGDPNLKWEIGHKFNTGFDFNVLENRLSGSIDVYNDITSDLFILQTYSAWDGVVGNARRTNAGEMRNRGIELLVNYDVIRRKDFRWSVNANISYNQNEILDLGQVEDFEQGTSIIQVGLPINSHYIVKWAGVNPATGDALYYTKDGEITNKYSVDDSVADFGSSEPPVVGGFGTNLSYKGFELSAQFNFAQGFYRYNNQTFFQENPNFAQFGMSTAMLDVWQQPGDLTEIQGVHSERQFSSKDIEDASFLRLRNLTIAYNFPKSTLNKLSFVRGVRFYAQGQNLMTWTKWTGFDPEDGNNIAQYEYPLPRTLTFGVDVTF